MKKLREFWEKNSSSREALESWNAIMKAVSVDHPNELKEVFNHADFIGEGIVIFNIKGNDFRLIAHIKYRWQVVFVLWIGSHAEYDKLSKEDLKKLRHSKKK